VLIVDDVTGEERSAERAGEAARMDSMGQLAAGLAHDLNNVLTGILGHAATAMAGVPAGSSIRSRLEAIRDLAECAAGLTRRLVLFSRRQTVDLAVLNLNALIEHLRPALLGLVGGGVELRFVPAADLGNISADPGQVEQVILNLVLNARDAMPEGGVLVIETANVLLDEEHAQRHRGVTPGLYAMVAVSDTGCGLDEETRARIFEPFFTTKGEGQGTGLGLATTYGIVKQHGGNIRVASQVGLGTTFTVFLPVVGAQPEPSAATELWYPLPRSAPMILVVEDADSVCGVVRDVLQDQDYGVLCAHSPAEAERVFLSHDGAVDLLLTDVALPGMTGPALYGHLARRCPGLKVLYMSGYPERVAVASGLLEPGQPFLQKPFSPAALARMVREVVEAQAALTGTSRSP